MICTTCGFENADDAVSCTKCNNSFGTSSEAAVSPAPAVPPPPPPQAASAAPPAPPVSSKPAVAPVQPAPHAYSAPPPRTTPPYPYQQPSYIYPAYVQKDRQLFTITDAYIVIGFVLAIVGIFVYAFLLLPISIGFSVVGFVKRTNSRTHGLSLAGIVVGVVACLIKVGLVLNELGLIPDWLSAGIF